MLLGATIPVGMAGALVFVGPLLHFLPKRRCDCQHYAFGGLARGRGRGNLAIVWEDKEKRIVLMAFLLTIGALSWFRKDYIQLLTSF